MKTEVIESARRSHDEILEDKINQLESLSKAIESDADAISKAEEEMEEATEQGDLKAYQKAKQKRVTAGDAFEMHTKHRDRLEGKPLISYDDYNDIINSIIDEMNENISDIRPRLKAFADEIREIGKELSDTVALANDTIREVELDLYLDADRKRDAKGNIFGEPRRYTGHYTLASWISRTTGEPLYTNVFGKEDPEDAEPPEEQETDEE